MLDIVLLPEHLQSKGVVFVVSLTWGGSAVPRSGADFTSAPFPKSVTFFNCRKQHTHSDMAAPNSAVNRLERPDPLHEVLKQDRPEDCTPCRIMGDLLCHKLSTQANKLIGASAFMGLGAYSYFSGHSQLKAQEAMILRSKSFFGMRSRQAGITSIALSLGTVGLYRLLV